MLPQELETLSYDDQQAIAHVWSLFSAAPSKHRNLMLQGILTQCCFPQLSFLSASVRELIRIDFLTALPPELSFKILFYLDTASLCKAAQVSRRWHMLADDDFVWHRMCEQHIDRKCVKCGWGLPLMERKRLQATRRSVQLRAAGRRLDRLTPDLTALADSDKHEDHEKARSPTPPIASNSSMKRTSPDGDSIPPPCVKRPCSGLSKEDQQGSTRVVRARPWKDVYRDRFKIGSNWKYGRCSINVFKGHNNGVMCLQFDDSILATGSYDATIKIWDIESGKELRTLRGHQSGIRALQFDDKKLISGSIDRSLKVWNWRTGECISTYTGHTGAVICLHFDSSILASGSQDTTIKVWNFEDKSTFCLRGHTDWVNAVRVQSASRTLFSASDDCAVKLWDLASKACLRTFDGHVGHVQQVLAMPDEFEYEKPEQETKNDDDPSTPRQDESAHQSGLASALVAANKRDLSGDNPALPRYMLSGALDSTVRLWDVASGKCLWTYFGHVQGIWALAADTLRIVSGAQDGMVKVWDPRTGKCERTFTGHVGPVTCVGLSDSRFCTGSEDCEVRMYSFEPEADNGRGGSPLSVNGVSG